MHFRKFGALLRLALAPVVSTALALSADAVAETAPDGAGTASDLGDGFRQLPAGFGALL
ncbi:MAG TPA: hypothetical protein VFR17_10880 [Mycobacterium sp.]|nr:hypothetical protein [Mycobacterium sp.]